MVLELVVHLAITSLTESHVKIAQRYLVMTTYIFKILIQVCHQGSCNGSLCAHYNLRDCFLTEGRPEDLCQLACEKNGGYFYS